MLTTAHNPLALLRLIKTPRYKINTRGEVRTDPAVVKYLLDQLPEHLWKQHNIFLDPCCGRGTFLVSVIERLRPYHSAKHIADMIIGVDIDPWCVYTSKRVVADYLGVSQQHVNITQGNVLTMKLHMKKPPVLLTNPPYTKEVNEDANGKNGRKNISTAIVSRVIKLTNPVWVGMIVPEALYSTESPNEHYRLRNDLFDKYSAYNVKFLHQERDWAGTIRIDTVAAVFGPRVSGRKVTVDGRHLNQQFDIDVDLDDTRVLNYETMDSYNWIKSIQNATPLMTKSAKDTGVAGPSMQISKRAPLSCNLVPGTVTHSNNTTWRVAFAMLRANTCAVVAPGVNIPTKYRYYVCSNQTQATMLRNYMLSEPVRFIVKLFHNSRSLGGKTLQSVPVFDFTTIVQQPRGSVAAAPIDIVDEDLYDHWKVSPTLRSQIHSFMSNLPNGEKVPF